MRGKMCDFPKELVIGESTWRVKWRRSIPEGGKGCVGLCCEEEKIIHIKLGQTRSERVSTFFHELLHAAEVEYGFEIPHRLIYKLEGPLSKVFLQNAWVQWAEWLKDAG